METQQNQFVSQPAPSLPPQNGGGNRRLVSIGVFLLLALIGFGVWFWTQNKNISSLWQKKANTELTQEKPLTQKITTTESNGLKTYRDEESGFEVSYPTDFVVYDEYNNGIKSLGFNIKKEIEGGKWVLWASFMASKEPFLLTDQNILGESAIPNMTFNGYPAINYGLDDGSRLDENCKAVFFTNSSNKDGYAPSCGAIIQVIGGPSLPIETPVVGLEITGSPGGVVSYGMYLKVGQEEAKKTGSIADQTYMRLSKEERYSTYGDPAKIYNENRPTLMQIISTFKFTE
jgi:hypothetical protein